MFIKIKQSIGQHKLFRPPQKKTNIEKQWREIFLDNLTKKPTAKNWKMFWISLKSFVILLKKYFFSLLFRWKEGWKIKENKNETFAYKNKEKNKTLDIKFFLAQLANWIYCKTGEHHNSRISYNVSHYYFIISLLMNLNWM